jgi:hypothetical protein
MAEPDQTVDICVACALPVEARAFRKVVANVCHVAVQKQYNVRHHYDYWSTSIKNNNGEELTLHISWPSRYGLQEMVMHLQHLVDEYQPRFTIMTGICAGDEKFI